MKKTKIDWCDCTINPVVGCKNKCKYCYARKINQRFGFIFNWEEPQFFEERLKQLNSKTPKSIFMDSMSDIYYWENGWISKTLNAMFENKQHNYIFLTKGNTDYLLRRMSNIRANIGIPYIGFFLGKSVTTQQQLDSMAMNKELVSFLSIEPLLEKINLSSLFQYNSGCKMIILGAETGNRKEKVIPKKEWIDEIVKECDKAHARVFMKESLKEIMGEDFRQDELIWEVNK